MTKNDPNELHDEVEDKLMGANELVSEAAASMEKLRDCFTSDEAEYKKIDKLRAQLLLKNPIDDILDALGSDGDETEKEHEMPVMLKRDAWKLLLTAAKYSSERDIGLTAGEDTRLVEAVNELETALA